MYKLCKTEQSAARQRELEQGLLTAMATQHYDEISVSDLCQQIGIPRKAFYRYFSGKDGALHALIDHTLLEYEGFGAGRRPMGQRTTGSDLETYFLFWQSKKNLLTALEHSGLSGVLIERSIDHVLSEVGFPSRFMTREEKSFREQGTLFGICGLMSMMVRWHHDGYPIPADRMAEIAVQLLTKPLFRDVESVN